MDKDKIIQELTVLLTSLVCQVDQKNDGDYSGEIPTAEYTEYLKKITRISTNLKDT